MPVRSVMSRSRGVICSPLSVKSPLPKGMASSGMDNLKTDLSEQQECRAGQPEKADELRRTLDAYLKRVNARLPTPNPNYNEKIKRRNKMKVVAFNGSPHKNGNTASALNVVLNELESEGIETELIQVGQEKLRGCMACHGCVNNQDGKCVFNDDPVNEWIEKMVTADGILFGSPVHFAGAGGTIKSFLDRAFFVASANGGLFRHKVGAAVAAVRRSGGIPTVDALNKFISYAEMIMPTSNYWNVAHGLRAGELEQDAEGIQIMSVLGKNMAWIMKIIEHGKVQIPAPESVTKTWTHFIR